MIQEKIDEIKKLIETHLDAKGLQLVELQLKMGKGTNVLKILIDRESGGITLAECAEINEEIGLLLDKSDLLTEKYLLEVSSPGLDRPLTTKEDFNRKMGKTVKIETKEPLDEEGMKEFVGVITGVENQAVTIKIRDGENKKIPYESIERAKVKLEW